MCQQEITKKTDQVALNNKRMHGQFFTVANPFAVDPFFHWFTNIPNHDELTLLEPFAGAANIIRLLREVGYTNQWKAFDIQPQAQNVIKQDTLADFPRGFTVAITNPPYLAKYSATRRGLSFPDIAFDDVYKFAIAQCLEHCEFVAAILPESFIHDRTLPFGHRLVSVVELNCRMFEDTEQPVCLALFGPQSNTDFVIYRMDRKLGTFSSLKRKLPEGETHQDWIFNHPNGEIALKAIDDTTGPSICFAAGRLYSPADIKTSSRLFTRIKIPATIRVQRLIAVANSILEEFRADTGDVFLTAFKGLRKDGMFRRRLDYAMARNILNTAASML